jgi:hypothetical protein
MVHAIVGAKTTEQEEEANNWEQSEPTQKRPRTPRATIANRELRARAKSKAESHKIGRDSAPLDFLQNISIGESARKTVNTFIDDP